MYVAALLIATSASHTPMHVIDTKIKEKYCPLGKSKGGIYV